MRHAYLVIILFFLVIGCGTNTPVTPDPVDTPDPVVTPEPILTAQIVFPDQTGTVWEGYDTTGYQEKFLEEGLDKVLINRSAQGLYDYDPDFVPDGTLMNDSQITCWLSAWMTDSISGWGGYGGGNPYTGCDWYITTYWQLTAYNIGGLPPPLSFSSYVVFVFEMNGYDVPDEPDIEPCDYCPGDYESPFGEMVCMAQLE